MKLITFLGKKHVVAILHLFVLCEKAHVEWLRQKYPQKKMIVSASKGWKLSQTIADYEKGRLLKRYLPKSLKKLKVELLALSKEDIKPPKTVYFEGGEKAVAPWQLRVGLFPKQVVEYYNFVFREKLQRGNAQKLMDRLVKAGLLEKKINPYCPDKEALELYHYFREQIRQLRRQGHTEYHLSKRPKYFITPEGKKIVKALVGIDYP